MESTIGKRITLARGRAGLSQERLAMMTGVSRSACSQWERGHATPSVENIARLARLLNVGFEWLATGREERNDSNQINGTIEYHEKKSVLSADQKEILAKYNQLTDRKKRLLLELIRLL